MGVKKVGKVMKNLYHKSSSERFVLDHQEKLDTLRKIFERVKERNKEIHIKKQEITPELQKEFIGYSLEILSLFLDKKDLNMLKKILDDKITEKELNNAKELVNNIYNDLHHLKELMHAIGFHHYYLTNHPEFAAWLRHNFISIANLAPAVALSKLMNIGV